MSVKFFPLLERCLIHLSEFNPQPGVENPDRDL